MMNRLKIGLILLHLIYSTSLLAQGIKGFPNPSALYCEKMGYEYEIKEDVFGNQVGFCTLPDGSEVNAWDFYRGKVKGEFSYCAKYGYQIKNKVIDHESYTEECPYCYDPKDKTKEISMYDLMNTKGDTLFPIEKEFEQEINKGGRSNQLKSSSSLPTSFDWRNYNGHSYIGPVRDQGLCGSCYAFAATACAEGAYNKATGSYDSNRKEFSESFIMWCLGGLSSYSTHFSGCNGADYEYKELSALTNEGVCELDYFPYQTSAPTNCSHWNDPKAIYSNWNRVSCNDISAIKEAIMKYGVVDAAVYVSSSFENYTGNIYVDNRTSCSGSPCSHTETNHAVSLVGWGHDNTYGDYWILRNSWGPSWGENGYMRIQASSARVSCAVSYLITDPVQYVANYISEENKIPSGENVEFIGSSSITLSPGFEANNGCDFIAKITSLTLNNVNTQFVNTDKNELKQFSFINIDDFVTTKFLSNKLSFYPNPVADILQITGFKNTSNCKVFVSNVQGERIPIEMDVEPEKILLNFANLPASSYIVRIMYDGTTQSFKIIKQ